MQSAGETGFQQGHQGAGEVIKLIMRGGGRDYHAYNRQHRHPAVVFHRVDLLSMFLILFKIFYPAPDPEASP